MSATTHGERGRAPQLLLAGIAGALFGAGLLVSGMAQPARVLAFLDVTGAWDPSLAFVMGGAVAIYAVAFRVILARRTRPWFDPAFHLPSRRALDPPLVAGAALFGIGWGLGGLCPGPGIVSAASGSQAGLAFTAAMLAGMYVQHRAARDFPTG